MLALQRVLAKDIECHLAGAKLHGHFYMLDWQIRECDCEAISDRLHNAMVHATQALEHL